MALDEAANRALLHMASGLFVEGLMVGQVNLGVMCQRGILGMQLPYAYRFWCRGM